MAKEQSDEKEEEVKNRVRFLNVGVHRNSKEEDEAVPPLWLITFADIMALMLTFFVLLYSMSTPDVEKWEDLTSAVNKGFSKFYSQPLDAGAQDAINIDKLDFSRALNLNYLSTLLSEIIKEDERLESTVIILQKDRLILSLPQDLLFQPGQYQVQVRGKQALFAIADLLTRIRNRVEVIGHTDPTPILNQAAEISSNWHLSLARATSVASVLRQSGYDKEVIVRGLSSARYAELPGDIPEEERLGYARRVDIVIMKDDGRGRLNILMGG